MSRSTYSRLRSQEVAYCTRSQACFPLIRSPALFFPSSSFLFITLLSWAIYKCIIGVARLTFTFEILSLSSRYSLSFRLLSLSFNQITEKACFPLPRVYPPSTSFSLLYQSHILIITTTSNTREQKNEILDSHHFCYYIIHQLIRNGIRQSIQPVSAARLKSIRKNHTNICFPMGYSLHHGSKHIHHASQWHTESETSKRSERRSDVQTGSYRQFSARFEKFDLEVIDRIMRLPMIEQDMVRALSACSRWLNQ